MVGSVFICLAARVAFVIKYEDIPSLNEIPMESWFIVSNLLPWAISKARDLERHSWIAAWQVDSWIPKGEFYEFGGPCCVGTTLPATSRLCNVSLSFDQISTLVEKFHPRLLVQSSFLSQPTG